MCDQTPVEYKDGDVVWVKLGYCWWPGEVCDLDKLPSDIFKSFKKPPMAAVKFFDEDKFEYVKTLDQIYFYNCTKKNEFIKKGMSLSRSKKNMAKFPTDVVTAEKKTNGDPDIINDPIFSPEKRPDYSALFGSAKQKKQKKSITSKRLSSSFGSSSSKSTPNRSITHPRFTTHNDHDVRILVQTPQQPSQPIEDEEKVTVYPCFLCGFKTTRINIIVMHNKSHVPGMYDPYISPIKRKKTTPKRKTATRMTKSNTTSLLEDLELIEKGAHVATESSDEDVPILKKSKKESQKQRKRPAKPKQTKQTTVVKDTPKQTDIRTDLLAEWDEESDDENDLTFNTTLESGTETSVASEMAASKLDDSKIESDSEKPLVPLDLQVPEPSKSCFDFEEDEDEGEIVSAAAAGRKIPRVIPPTDWKKLDSDSDDELVKEKDEPDVDVEAFNDILSLTAVPSLPELPQLAGFSGSLNSAASKGDSFLEDDCEVSETDGKFDMIDDFKSQELEGSGDVHVLGKETELLQVCDDISLEQHEYNESVAFTSMEESYGETYCGVNNALKILEESYDLDENVRRDDEIPKDDSLSVSMYEQTVITEVVKPIEEAPEKNDIIDSIPTNEVTISIKDQPLSLMEEDLLASIEERSIENVGTPEDKLGTTVDETHPLSGISVINKAGSTMNQLGTVDPIEDATYPATIDDKIKPLAATLSKSPVKDTKLVKQDSRETIDESIPINPKKRFVRTFEQLHNEQNKLSHESSAKKAKSDHRKPRELILERQSRYKSHFDLDLSELPKKILESPLHEEFEEPSDAECALNLTYPLKHAAIVELGETKIDRQVDDLIDRRPEIGEEELRQTTEGELNSSIEEYVQTCISFSCTEKNTCEGPEDLSALSTLAAVSELTTSFHDYSRHAEPSKILADLQSNPENPNPTFLTEDDFADGQIEIASIPLPSTKPVSLTSFSVDFENSEIAKLKKSRRKKEEPDLIEQSLGKVFAEEVNTESDSSRDSTHLDVVDHTSTDAVHVSSPAKDKPEYSSTKLLEILTDGKAKSEAHETNKNVESPTKTGKLLEVARPRRVSSKFDPKHTKFVIKTANKSAEKNKLLMSIEIPDIDMFVIKKRLKCDSDCPTIDTPSSDIPDVVENEEVTVADIVANQEEKLTDVVVNQEEKVPDIVANQEDKVTDVAANQGDKVTEVAANQEDNKVTDVFENQEEKITDVVENQEEKVSVVVANQEEKVADFVANQEEKVSQVVEEKVTDVVANQEAKVPQVIAKQEVKVTDVVANQEQKVPQVVANQEEKLRQVEKIQIVANQRENKFSQVIVANQGKAKILQQTIIKPSGVIAGNKVKTQPADDGAVFDINSMPIVLSDEILTPENIEKMPVVLSEPTTSVIKTAPASHLAKLLPERNMPLKPRTYSNKLNKESKIISKPAVKIQPVIKTQPAFTSRSGVSEKFIIVPSSGIPSLKQRQTLLKRTTSVLAPTATATSTKPQSCATPEPSGNKIMIITNEQGKQSRLLLTPAHQKLLGYQGAGNKLVKATLKGNILQKSSSLPIVKSTLKPVHSFMGLNSELTKIGERKLIIPNKFEMPKIKRFHMEPQKVSIQPEALQSTSKTIIIKNPQGQVVKKIHGTDDALLEQQVQEQVNAIKASGSFAAMKAKQEQVNKPPVVRPIFKRSYSKKTPIIETTTTTPPRSVIKSHLLLNTGATIKTPKEIVPPLSPIAPKKVETHLQPKVSALQAAMKVALKEISKKEMPVVTPPPPPPVKETESKPQKSVNQLIIRDAQGNQTTITEGQILALPSGETVDGQPQSYMLVTLDESGSITPLNDEALVALKLGGELGNMIVQLDNNSMNQEAEKAAKAPEPKTPAKEPEQPTQTISPVVEVAAPTQIISNVEAAPTQTISTVCNLTGSNSMNNQQFIITGDPVSTQKFLESLSEGNQDLANLLASGESNILIQTDEQQILINTDGQNQLLMPLMDSEGAQSAGGSLFPAQTKSQDILAAALADTDVLQQDTSVPNKLPLSPSSGLYPNTVANVLETTLSLSSPIMTPLEVPSTNTKKIPDSETNILTTEIPKNVDLPITITDPNITQTVSQQQLLAAGNNLDLPLSISDPGGVPLHSAEMNSPSSSFVYPLPLLDEERKDYSGPISMPLLNEDSQSDLNKGESDDLPSKTSKGLFFEKGNDRGFLVALDNSNSDGLLGDDDLCTSLSVPPPDMFDLAELNSDYRGLEMKQIAPPTNMLRTELLKINANFNFSGNDNETPPSPTPVEVDENSSEIPVQPPIVTDLSANKPADLTKKSSKDD